MKVYAAINAVTTDLAKVGIAKDSRNAQQNYAFRGIDAVLNTLAPLLSTHKLCILPRVLARETTERESRNGGTLFTTVLDMEFDFVHAEDGSKHTVRVVGEAMDSADKSCNKAMSAGYKYAAFQAFCIPTEGDNDADAQTHDVKPRANAEPEHVTQLRESLKQPRRQSAQEPPAEDDGIGPRVKYTKIAKEGTNDKGPWTLYAVGLTDGREGTTFSKSIYAAAKDLMEHGRVVTAKFQGKNLLAIAPQEIPDSRDEAPF